MRNLRFRLIPVFEVNVFSLDWERQENGLLYVHFQLLNFVWWKKSKVRSGSLFEYVYSEGGILYDDMKGGHRLGLLFFGFDLPDGKARIEGRQAKRGNV